MQSLKEAKFKIVILGDYAVGKTSLVRAFVEKKFSEDYIPSIGVNLYVKEVLLEHEEKKLKVILTLWDIAGQKMFKSMLPAYHLGANGVLFVADLTRPDSFVNLTDWCQDLRKNIHQPLPTILLANKSDLEGVVDDSAIAKTVQNVGASAWFRTSAKTGDKVQDAFKALALDIFKDNFGKF
jgi:small GTP-binding protein